MAHLSASKFMIRTNSYLLDPCSDNRQKNHDSPVCVYEDMFNDILFLKRMRFILLNIKSSFAATCSSEELEVPRPSFESAAARPTTILSGPQHPKLGPSLILPHPPPFDLNRSSPPHLCLMCFTSSTHAASAVSSPSTSWTGLVGSTYPYADDLGRLDLMSSRSLDRGGNTTGYWRR
ncbi:uncharacterized protein LOC124708907 [Lolium rigidum]|uniref:uncharacterized protein LOC124708907 n=1 Tax=Lolium rigidum TaxID=89674 RepID=UPI001F5DBC65|nr:uncharacterized protein LOC124708907 [Lolium rigidum]